MAVAATYTVFSDGRVLTEWTIDATHALPAATPRHLRKSLPRVGLHAPLPCGQSRVRAAPAQAVPPASARCVELPGVHDGDCALTARILLCTHPSCAAAEGVCSDLTRTQVYYPPFRCGAVFLGLMR